MAIFLSILVVSSSCLNDAQCGAKRVCVKPEDSIYSSGVCAVPPLGKNVKWGAPFVRDATVCVSNADCSGGSKCVKQKSWDQGICSR